MVALPAAAIERNRLPAMALRDLAQPCRDFGNRHLPRDRVEAAVGAPAQRRRQAIAVMGIERDAGGLVAEIALRFRIVAVAAHLCDPVVLDQHLDAAVHVAEIAGRLVPARFHLVLPSTSRGPRYMIIII